MQNRTYMQTKKLTGALCRSNQVILKYSICYPQFASYSQMPYLSILNAQYRQEAFALERKARNEYYVEAAQDFDSREEDGFPFNQHELQRTVCATLLTGQAISLYMDTYRFTGGAHGNTLRQGDSWDLVNERPLKMRDLFPRGTNLEEALMPAILACIACQSENFFPDYETLARENFDPSQFYLSMRDLFIFYQQYDIAPYSSGIPVFPIPMKEVGASLPD